jgi:hypothetical protein
MMTHQMVAPNMSDQQWLEMAATLDTSMLETMLPLIDSQAIKFQERAKYVRMILALDESERS